MKRFLLFTLFIILLGSSWSIIKEQLNGDLGIITDRVQSILENEELEATVVGFFDTVKLIFNELEDTINIPSEKDVVEKPELHSPEKQTFSIHNIEIGMKKEEVETKLGNAERISLNEYGKNWHTYHQNFQNFAQIMYNEKDEVVGLYTNQDLISSTYPIKLGSSKAEVRNHLGDPLTRIMKGLIIYEFQADSDYDIFQVDDHYVTIFYDIHEENTVTSIQIISESVEKGKKDFYAAANEELREGFELQMFDLTNATRVKHGLEPLVWDDKVRGTARKHSADMAKHHYFNHTNLKGESPFDRMLTDQITFSVAGENLAYGQFSSIFAHEGLMNSMGHRKNILKSDFDYLGVGVAFNAESHPYYTQKYYSK